MPNALKPYDTYAPVAYDYIRQLPAGWKLLPNIAIFQERIEKNGINEDVLSVSAIKGIVKSADYEDRKDRTSDDKSDYLIVHQGDIPYNTMLMWAGAVGRSEYRGIVSPAYTVLKTKKGSEINTKYYHYMFRSQFYCDYSKRFSYGIVDSRLRLYYTYFKRMYSIVPPLETQNKIVAYLDLKTAQIQEVIQKKERIIELLEEERKSIISKVVTKGLNTNAKMKDSGIEWIGEIPEEWEIRKMKHIIHLQSGTNLTSEEISENASYPVYGGNGLRGYYDDYNNQGHFVLIGRQGALCGNINYAKDKFWATEHAVVCYPKMPLDVIWLGEMLRTMNLNQYSIASAQPGLAVERIMNLSIPIPPFNEQQLIASFFDKKNTDINNIITTNNQQISKLQEYQDSLITQVVTGQVNVE